LSKTTIRRLAVGVFALNLLAVTWPLAEYVRSPDPQILGLPFSMAWPIVWIIIGWITLFILDRSENRDRSE